MTTARTLQPEDQIAHYRIVAPLGAGGMGEVYLAQDSTLGRQVALKILPPELVRSEERVRRFVQEAKSASSLNHPNIVTIYEIGEDQVRSAAGDSHAPSSAVRYISMEVVAGKTLAAKIYDEKTDLRTLLGYLAQAAEGIAKAHAAGIVHRDLKPGNIMVSDDGFAKVLDFGLAKLTERSGADPSTSNAPTEMPDPTIGGVLLGTAGYMSPEQAQGRLVDARSDVFSFGCVLYEAATRSRPFAADSTVETIHRVLHDKPAPIEDLNPKVPAELRRLIRKCLAKSVDQRMQSMKDIAIDLREIAEEFETLSASASSGSSAGSGPVTIAPPPRMSRGVRATVAAVAFVGLAGIGLGVYGIRSRVAGRNTAKSSEHQLEIATVPSRGSLTGAALAPDGKYLAYLSGAEGQTSLFVRQISTGAEVKIHSSPKVTLYTVAYSPSGEHLWYLEFPSYVEGGSLYQVPALGGAPRKIATQVYSGIAFSPDGSRIGFQRMNPATAESSLVVHELAGGKEKILTTVKLPTNLAGGPAWSPDGKSIAIAVHNPENGVHGKLLVFGVDDGKQAPLGRTTGWEAESMLWHPDGRRVFVSGLKYGASDSRQLWEVSFPGGETRRITADYNDYSDLSVSRDGLTIASVRQSRVANLWTLPSAGRARPRQLTFNSSSDNQVVGFDVARNGTIVYSAPTGHHLGVHAVGIDGGGTRQLNVADENAYVQKALPDGGLIATVYAKDSIAHIGRADSDGGNARHVTSGSGEWYQDASRDGKVVLFQRVDSLRDCWAISADGGEPRKVATNVDQMVGFSPDDSKIAYLTPPEIEGKSNRLLLVVPAAGGEPIAKLSLPPDARFLQWAPDGTAFLFLAGDAVTALFRAPLVGGAAQAITHFDEGQIPRFVSSRDGKSIWLIRKLGDASNLWRIGSDGRDPTALTDFLTGSVFELGLTDDGNTVVFTYGNETQDPVLVRSFD